MVKFAEIEQMGKAWAAQYCKALNASATYAKVAKGWGLTFDGGMLFVMEKCGEMEDDITAFLDLKDGKCLGITIVAPGKEPPRKPILTLRAPMLTWRRIIFKEIDPIGAIMQGKLALTGEMTLVMRYTRAAVELVNVTENTDRALFTKFNLGDG
nr:SCP2 sterol-binding domain-containing protein [Candidatus Sigynarchaeum springense]